MYHCIPYSSGRIAILSDLHIDSYVRASSDLVTAHGLEVLLTGSLDALIVAGDLTNGPGSRWKKGLDYLATRISPERIYVFPGNHDYYGGSLAEDQVLAEHARSIGAHFVQKGELRHGDTRLFCCTLWTDFDLLGDAETAMGVAGRIMRDYSQIWKEIPAGSRDGVGWPASIGDIEPSDILAVHRDHRDWLESKLMAPHPAGEAGRTVVVTHHGPHLSVAGPVDSGTPAFHSDMTDLIMQFEPAAWFFGHSHRRLRATVGQTDVRNVSVGYAGEIRRAESECLIEASIWES